MTGFGKGVASFKDARITVELKTFNHKFFEFSCKLPQNLQPLEEQIKKRIRKGIKRGKLYLWVNFEQTYDKSLDISHRKLNRVTPKKDKQDELENLKRAYTYFKQKGVQIKNTDTDKTYIIPFIKTEQQILQV